MKKLLFLSMLMLLVLPKVYAVSPSTFAVQAYIETYYVYDFNNPANQQRPSFVYSHHRHNEVNLNLGFVKLAYGDSNARANFALMAGTYANANLASEPGVLQNIFEANAGLRLSKTSNTWVDIGIFPSHIGFESAIGKDCWNVTRSILADNSPYYEAGAKLSHTTENQEWFFSALLVNGWQRIQRVSGNNTLAVGHQITYQPSSTFKLNSSSFVGSDTPDSVGLMRYFHNFYGQVNLAPKLDMIVGFDVGAQQASTNSSEYNIWYSPVVIVKYGISDDVSVSTRGEFYYDKNGVIISTGTPDGFQTYGLSANVDYQLSANAVWRFECRGFYSKHHTFVHGTIPSTQNYFCTTSIAVSL
jgi:hypothetical protein